MRVLMDHIFEIKALADGLNDNIVARYNLPTSHMPIAGLNMASNRIVLALELMEYYSQVFDKPANGSLEDNISFNHEQSQRVIDVLSSCFVGVMSSLESCSRKASSMLPNLLGAPPKTLFNLVEKSASIGWISRADESVWKRLIDIRNAQVHNNGEFSFQGELSLYGDIIWKFRPGAQSKVGFRHLTACLRWAISSYGAWCVRFLEAWNKEFDYCPSWGRLYSYEVRVSKVLPVWGRDTWGSGGGWSWS